MNFLDEKIKSNSKLINALLWINEYHFDTIRFVVTYNDIKSINLYFLSRQYDMIMYCYGNKFLLALLEYFEKLEMFEECEEIVKQIKEHNEICRDDVGTKLFFE